MTTDKINHPPHYTAHASGVECIQITEGFSFNIGNIIKYLWRADEKGAPIDDLRKAEWYLQREITRRINEANTSPLVTKSVSLPDADAPPVEIRKMAAGGDRHAQQYLADCYAHGWYGLPVSDVLSSTWRSMAREPRTEEEEP